MAVLYQCDLCDEKASIEVELRLLTVNGALCRERKKHLCQKHAKLANDFDLSLVATSAALKDTPSHG